MRIALFVLILLVVTGLVAASGDRMGHLAARRKVRFGGLRPRYVSTVIAVVTGILIAATTFGLIFALSADFRDAFTHYDTLQQNLSETREQLDTQQQMLDTANREAEDAKNQAAIALDEKAAIEADVSRLRGEKVGLAMVLGDTQLALDDATVTLSKREREIAAAVTRKRELEADIESLEGFIASVLKEHTLALGDIADWREREVVISVGTYLDYMVMSPTSATEFQSLLTARVDKLTEAFTRNGFTMDTAISNTIQQFADSVDLDDTTDTVIIISTARNVLAGGEVMYSFEARPLKPLMGIGDDTMTVLVKDNSAGVSWRGESIAELTIAEEFDEQSFALFAEELWSIFNTQAINMGFLPELDTGEVPNPIGALAAIYDNLVSRERPFLIQFITKSSANAINGLADCEIYVSKWPPER